MQTNSWQHNQAEEMCAQLQMCTTTEIWLFRTVDPKWRVASIVFPLHSFTYTGLRLVQQFIVEDELAKRLDSSTWWDKFMAWNEQIDILHVEPNRKYVFFTVQNESIHFKKKAIMDKNNLM